MIIPESYRNFGPYDEKDCFHIEASVIYQRIQQDMKIAEFLLLRPQTGGLTVWVIEAKSSAPKPNNQIDFDKYIDEIREKLTNALMLGIAICLNRHPHADKELPDHFKSLNLATAKFKLILVITGGEEEDELSKNKKEKLFKQEWLPPIQDALQKNLRIFLKIWGGSVSDVLVMNDEMARQYKLIS